jgi:uncharacterized repeat protein (TIGR01451 family)
LDTDQNGIFGGADLPIANRTVQADPANLYAPTGVDGDFLLGAPAGSYVLTVPSTSSYQQVGPFPQVDLVGEGLSSPGHLIPMTATASLVDLSLQMHIQSAVRPGFTHILWLHVMNEGTQVTGGDLTFTVDPLAVLLLGDTGVVVTDNTLTWHLPPLQLGEVVAKRVWLSIQTDVELGTIIHYSGSITADQPDADSANDQFVEQPVVVGSCDPNDIQVRPEVLSMEEVAAHRQLIYTIRFQNTGTFEADFVRIADVLPNNVDPATFQFISSSHPCQTMIANRLLEFRFNNIMLPDSGSNEEESHGYVTFRITPNDDLVVGDTVSNSADIFFDFNAAVVTNSAIVTVESGMGMMDPRSNIDQVWPNPVKDFLNISMLKPLSGHMRMTIIDMHGRELHDRSYEPVNCTTQVPVMDLSSGVYVIHVRSDQGTTSYRFVKE